MVRNARVNKRQYTTTSSVTVSITPVNLIWGVGANGSIMDIARFTPSLSYKYHKGGLGKEEMKIWDFVADRARVENKNSVRAIAIRQCPFVGKMGGIRMSFIEIIIERGVRERMSYGGGATWPRYAMELLESAMMCAPELCDWQS